MIKIRARPDARTLIVIVLATVFVACAPSARLSGTELPKESAPEFTLTDGVTGATVSLSQAGVLSCANANLSCTGATRVAQYNVQGSNQQTVRISAPNVTLVNQSDATQTLTLVTNAPASIVLTNSGFPGVDFSIGGSVTINSTTGAGTYLGTFNVTVDY